ncbi:hypothetical protein LBYZC6_17690 [Lacrimispora brassicae]
MRIKIMRRCSMTKQCKLYGSIFLLLVIFLVMGILPITGVAQGDSAKEVIPSFDVPVTEATVSSATKREDISVAQSDGAIEVITSFDVPVTVATVSSGTKREDIPLPETLTATLEDGTVADIPVTWDDGGLYNEDMAGTYTFTADIGTYLYGQAPPVAVVTVTEPSAVLSGSIGGRLWLDKNADGVMDEDESGVADYPVNLYMADDPHAAVETAKTGTDGTYSFENIEPGSYVVGIASEMMGETEYLLPVIGISGDNKFELVEMDEETIMAFSETIVISEDTDTAVEAVNAGIRLPAKKIGRSWTAGNYTQLKNCISQALENDIIVISGDIVFSTSETITINKSLTFRSGSGNPVTFSQAAARRHFIIDSTVNGGTVELTFEDIVFDGKKNGGGFEVKAGKTLKLNLTNSVIQNCKAVNGGGFQLNTGATLTLYGGKISGNTATQNGAGIYVDSGKLTVHSTEISGNTVTQNGAGIFADKSIVSIQNSRICNNSVSLFTDNRLGGGLYAAASEISVEDSEISGNKATHGSGFSISKGTLTVNNTKISNNIAILGGGIQLNSMSDDTTLIITGSEISGNEADMLGGGIYDESGVPSKSRITIEECRIFGNKAGSYGGAIASSRGDTTVTNSNIFSNTAGYGGGIFVSNGSSLTVSGGEISDNAALASAGYFGGGQGGGIHGRFGSTVTIKDDGKVTSNVAESVESNSGRGGGIYLYQSQLVVESGEISGNMAKQGGGGIYSENAGTVIIEAGNIAGNVAPNGGGIYMNPLANLTVTSNAVVFNNNIAGKANDKSEVDMLLHEQKIHTTHFTTPFDFAYNNFDVGYKTTATGVFFTVNFDSLGGSRVNPKIAAPGSTIAAPSPGPIRDGYSFVGWYRNANGTNPWNFASDTVISNMTLYGKWVQGSSVTVSKTVTGDYADKTKEFNFIISFMNEAGSKLPEGTQFLYTGSIISGSGAAAPIGGMLTLDSNGEASFPLKHGQQITVVGVPINSKVKIAEVPAAGYTTSYRYGNEIYTEEETEVYTLTGTVKTFAFINSRAAVVPTGVSTGSSKSLAFLVLPILLVAGLGTGKVLGRYKRSL